MSICNNVWIIAKINVLCHVILFNWFSSWMGDFLREAVINSTIAEIVWHTQISQYGSCGLYAMTSP